MMYIQVKQDGKVGHLEVEGLVLNIIKWACEPTNESYLCAAKRWLDLVGSSLWKHMSCFALQKRTQMDFYLKKLILHNMCEDVVY